MTPALARKLLDGEQHCLVMLMLPTSLLQSLADSDGVGEGGTPEVWPLGGSRNMGGGRGSIFLGPLLVQFAPFLWPPMLLAPGGGGGGRGHLGKIVQWSLHHGSVIMSYLPGSSDHTIGLRGDEGGTSVGAQGVSISFQPQTKPAVKERKCTERAGTQLRSSPPLGVGGSIPGKPCLLSSLISPCKGSASSLFAQHRLSRCSPSSL
uniref:Uncharacterized protein n=1 Tax=Myotis myotis TaxID=51298 RepID=A0A7J7VIZ0_MYOMY|nr:hypothetical protein mMyoMyo1_008366 [Myotis myotis]